MLERTTDPREGSFFDPGLFPRALLQPLFQEIDPWARELVEHGLQNLKLGLGLYFVVRVSVAYFFRDLVGEVDHSGVILLRVFVKLLLFLCVEAWSLATVGHSPVSAYRFMAEITR